MLDRLAERLQNALDAVEAMTEQSGLGSVLLGVVPAIGVIALGVMAFIAVFAILVEFVP